MKVTWRILYWGAKTLQPSELFTPTVYVAKNSDQKIICILWSIGGAFPLSDSLDHRILVEYNFLLKVLWISNITYKMQNISTS